MMSGWRPERAGVLVLPSGHTVRGRSLRRPADEPADFGLYLACRQHRTVSWESRWLRWPDFWVPTDRDAADRALLLSWRLLTEMRVEIGCRGGVGRTGTALACLVVLDGLGATEAIGLVRARYHPRAVETGLQRRWVTSFAARHARS